MKCDRCGLESPLEGMFSKTPAIGMLCPTCVKRRRRGESRKSLALCVVGFISVIVLGKMGLLEWPYLDVPWFLVFLCAVTAVHELGHVVGHWLAGFPVWRISLGDGKLLARRLIGPVEVELRLGLGGFVTGASLDMRAWRWRRLVCIASGPLADLAVFTAAFHLAGGWNGFMWGSQKTQALPWSMLALASGLNFAGNLLCLGSVQTGLGMFYSDGKQILHLLKENLPPVNQRQLAYYATFASILLERKDYATAKELLMRGIAQIRPGFTLKLMLAYVQLVMRKYEVGRTALLDLRNAYPTQDAFRAAASNALAWADLMIGGEQRIDEADVVSAEAYLLLPWEASIQSTRGLALLERRGDVTNARLLLLEALQGAERNESKASVLCSLAMAEQRSGNRAEAQKYLERARRLDGNCEMLARTEGELTEAIQQAS